MRGTLGGMANLTYRVFSIDVVLGGGNCFCGERKCEEYPKNERNLLLFGGGGGGGGIQN